MKHFFDTVWREGYEVKLTEDETGLIIYSDEMEQIPKNLMHAIETHRLHKMELIQHHKRTITAAKAGWTIFGYGEIYMKQITNNLYVFITQDPQDPEKWESWRETFPKAGGLSQSVKPIYTGKSFIECLTSADNYTRYITKYKDN